MHCGMMKRILLSALAAIWTAALALAAEPPFPAKEIQWLLEYSAEAGALPDSSQWVSTYGAAGATMADGALQLDHASPDVDGYQCY